MKKHPLAALLIWAALFLSGCHVRTAVLLTQAQPANSDFYAETPLTYEHGIPSVEVVIEGKPYRFAVVAGVPTSYISSKVLDNLRAKKTHWTKINGYAIQLATLEELQIGGVSFRNTGMMAEDTLRWEGHTCEYLFDGALGDNILINGVWQFDYLGGKLRIASDASRMPAPAGFAQYMALQIHEVSGMPRVALKLESGAEQKALICTGYPGGLTLPLALRQQVSQPEALRPAYLHCHNCTLADTLYHYSPRQLLMAGRHLIIGPEVVFKGEEAALGNAFLRHYIFTINYPGKELWLERQARAPKYDDTSCHCGFGFTYLGGQWVVHYLLSGTAAIGALQLGDELLSINHQSFAQLTPLNHCEIDWEALRAASENMVVVIRRNGRELQFTLPRESGFMHP